MPPKGSRLTDEARAKLSAFRKGKDFIPPETRARMAAARRGSRHTLETRAKISAGNKGRVKSAQELANLAAALRGKPSRISPAGWARIIARRLGKPLSAETRAKISAAHIGHPVSAETRAKIGAASAQRTMSTENRRRLSALFKGKPKSPEHRAKIAAALRGQTIPEAVKLKQSAVAKLRQPPSAATRAKMSASQKLKVFTPEHRANLRKAWEDGRCHVVSAYTSLARALHAHLQQQGLVLEPEIRFGRFTVDLYDREHHVAYEADGSYWHDRNEAARPGARERRDAYLAEKFGLPVVHFSTDAIKALTGWPRKAKVVA